MSKVGWIYVGENAAPQDPKLLAYWESQPPAGRDKRPAACVKRIKDAFREVMQSYDIHSPTDDIIFDALEDCDELERVLCP